MIMVFSGITLFVLLALNILLGHRIIKADRKVHIILGWVILLLALMHGINGIIMALGLGQ
ncbi:MAG: hypothetical protein AB1439_04270 [candidate division FCPU426 bacterium]